MTARERTDTSDGTLISRVADGDVAAFEALYERHRSAAFGLALRVTRHPGVAEEVTQDAFMSLWRSAAGFDPRRASVSTWLLSVVRYRAIDALRSGSRHGRNVGLDDPAAEHLQSAERIEALVEDRDQAQHTREALTDLPEEQRRVVELAFFVGLSQAEIAAKTGIPLGTVKGRMRLALAKLQGLLAGEHQLAGTA